MLKKNKKQKRKRKREKGEEKNDELKEIKELKSVKKNRMPFLIKLQLKKWMQRWELQHVLQEAISEKE